ncbi:hypothetical protein [Pseudorhodobacter sp.]|uniref:hypothetical protein n=1 Tax=Pseudorhodobacter sp. TaxID=1934400 RepID=UPI003463C892
MDDYTAAGAELLQSPPALSFDMSRCVEAPVQFILRIEWAAAEAHLQGFRGSREFQKFFPHIRACLNDLADMRHDERLLPNA